MGRKNHHHQKFSFFNPACCIIPITASRVVPRKHSETSTHSSNHSPSPAGVYTLHDPSSPRIGCVGQIKRDKYSCSSSSSSSSYVCATSTPFNSSKIADPVKANNTTDQVRDAADVFELNRPLPVPKHAGATKACPVNLWKRRCGGHVIETLQLEPSETTLGLFDEDNKTNTCFYPS